MNRIDQAIKLDNDEEIVQAAELYETIINEENAPLDAFLNLACLYWESTDYGFNTGHRLPRGFV